MRLAAREAITAVAQSFGVIVTLLPDHMSDALEHNIRAAFIAGLTTGMSRELLLLQLGDGSIPLDFRDLAAVCRRPEQISDALRDFAPRILELYQAERPGKPETGRTLLQDLNLGASVAENEFRDLEAYYLEVDAYYRALRGEVRVVLGRKGSGKTALFARLRDEKRRNRRNVVVDIKPEGYKLLKFKEESLGLVQLGTLEHTVTAFWNTSSCWRSRTSCWRRTGKSMDATLDSTSHTCACTNSTRPTNTTAPVTFLNVCPACSTTSV